MHGVAKDSFQDARGLIIAFLVRETQVPGTTRESLADVLELCKIYTSEPTLQNVDESVAAIDKKNMSSIHVWAHLALGLKSALAKEEDDGTARAIMTLSSSICNFKANNRHIGCEPSTQAYMNEITGYVDGLKVSINVMLIVLFRSYTYTQTLGRMPLRPPFGG
jgi:hypothetical protein